MWVPQAQFAGYLVAAKKGFFRDQGLDVDLRPAGPDLKPQVSVAAGTDDMGVAVSNQLVTANANGVPLVAVAQVFQDSANRYIAKKSSGIKQLQDVRGRKVGLWTGGDEVEFIAMLKKAGMSEKDVKIIPEGFSVAPFLNGDYDLSMVTTYNELNQVLASGVKRDDLTVLSPADYGCAIVGDVLFTSRDYAQKNPEVVTKVISAMLQGWDYAKQHPDETVDLILGFNKELKRDEQRKQLSSALELVYSRSALKQGIGYIDRNDYQTAERILFQSGQIKKHVDVNRVFDLSYWQKARAGK